MIFAPKKYIKYLLRYLHFTISNAHNKYVVITIRISNHLVASEFKLVYSTSLWFESSISEACYNKQCLLNTKGNNFPNLQSSSLIFPKILSMYMGICLYT